MFCAGMYMYIVCASPSMMLMVVWPMAVVSVRILLPFNHTVLLIGSMPELVMIEVKRCQQLMIDTRTYPPQPER